MNEQAQKDKQQLIANTRRKLVNQGLDIASLKIFDDNADYIIDNKVDVNNFLHDKGVEIELSKSNGVAKELMDLVASEADLRKRKESLDSEQDDVLAEEITRLKIVESARAQIETAKRTKFAMAGF